MAEHETRWLSDAEQRVWRAYLDMHARLTAQLSRDLADDAGISITDFAVLVQLSEHPAGPVRAGELALALGWEKSRLSHQLARMERRGLLSRSNCAEDRRSAVVALTAEGRRVIEEAAPKHVAAVRRYLFDHLSAGQLTALGEIASAVIDRLGAVEGCPPVEQCPDEVDQ